MDDEIPYEECFSAQIPALAAEGQQRLRNASVLVVGAGRIGGPFGMNIVAAGVGKLWICDGQTVKPDNLNSFVFTPADLGKKKVAAIAERLAAYEHVQYRPIPFPVEAPEVDPYIEGADLVVCCANTPTARLTTEEKALRYGKRVLQVASFDARDCLGGVVSLRLPENSWSACAGCYLDSGRNWTSAGSLLATVTSALAAAAADMAVSIVSGVRTEVFRQRNVFYFDLENYSVEALSVRKRDGCPVCGTIAKSGT